MIGSVSQSENAPKITLSEFTDPEELMDKELDTRVMGERQPSVGACFTAWVRVLVVGILGEAASVTAGTSWAWGTEIQKNFLSAMWLQGVFPTVFQLFSVLHDQSRNLETAIGVQELVMAVAPTYACSWFCLCCGGVPNSLNPQKNQLSQAYTVGVLSLQVTMSLIV